jgi:hypothetical protein
MRLVLTSSNQTGAQEELDQTGAQQEVDQFEPDAVADRYALAYCDLAKRINNELDQPLQPTSWSDELVFNLRSYQLSPTNPLNKFFGNDSNGNLVKLVPTRHGLKAGHEEDAPIRCTELPEHLIVRTPRQPKSGEAIWTDDQVQRLNHYQYTSKHPYIFINAKDNRFVGIATKYGWVEKEGGPVVEDSHLKVSDDLIKC